MLLVYLNSGAGTLSPAIRNRRRVGNSAPLNRQSTQKLGYVVVVNR